MLVNIPSPFCCMYTNFDSHFRLGKTYRSYALIAIASSDMSRCLLTALLMSQTKVG
jgi:hypothetical protein